MDRPTRHGKEMDVTDTDTEKDQDAGEGTGDQEEEGSGSEPDYQADATKWKALARKHEANAKKNAEAAKPLAEMEDSSKSDIEQATAATTAAEKRAEAAEAKAARYEVALEKQVPANLMKFLAGETREDIEASADELLAAINPADTGGSKTSGKPKESLRPGANSEDHEPLELDPAKLAAQIDRL